jgi:hypothetical protein
MDELKLMILKRFGAGIFRSFLQAVAILLIAFGVVSKDWADSVILELSPVLLGLALSIGTAYVQYKKAKENELMPRVALEMPPGTSLEVVKTEVKAKL